MGLFSYWAVADRTEVLLLFHVLYEQGEGCEVGSSPLSVGLVGFVQLAASNAESFDRIEFGNG